MFGMTDTALSIYITQIPIALAILFAAILILHVKKAFIDIFNKQLEINKQNKELIEKLKKLYEEKDLVYE